MANDPRFHTQPRVELPGSYREPFPASAVGTPEGLPGIAASRSRRDEATLTVSVIVRRLQPLDTAALGTPEGRMTRTEYLRQYGPDPAAIQRVEAFAQEYRLRVLPDMVGPRTLQLSGTVHDIERAFGVVLIEQTGDTGAFHTREGAIWLPEELIGAVDAVLGLDNRPQAEPHFRFLPAAVAGTSYTPVQVAQLYGFPAGATASGQTIGIVELGGGYRTTDLDIYFQGLGLPVPSVTAVSVDGGTNSPGAANSADGEVMLDIEVCGAVAPGAKIAVYFAPNTDQGFIDAITTAVHDTVNQPSVISISWGGPETSWTAQARDALDAACQSAAALGVTITVACGDNGSSDSVQGGANAVDFPASSPHVLACGGTRLDAAGGSITSEVVWNEQASNEGATGGGVSAVFSLPAWQANSNVPAAPASGGGRGVPDVAGNADPVTGYTVRVDGQDSTIGGTSAVAPLWAGLIALANQANGRSAGFINPTIYGVDGAAAFRDITQGNNGSFAAGPGWDACTGLGSPVGAAVIQLLGGS